MENIKHVGVIDIGKTNVKVAVVDLAGTREVGVLTRPNTVLEGPPYPHFDIEAHWHFICRALEKLHQSHGIDALSVTAHGASGVLLDKDGNLAAPVMDYEFRGPDDLASEYDAFRPQFEETGSPRLGMGLNLGAQLFWQFTSDPGLPGRTAAFLTYPQYWAYRLTGIQANEVTSLGCHTDLWSPENNRFSSLVEKLELSDKMAPVKRAIDCLGSISAVTSKKTGLPEGTRVACGIHDSNASLYPHLLKRKAPFSVVSTGTWVIAMSIGGKQTALDPARDTLINVNALGDPVPSARFMGGREFEIAMDGDAPAYTERDVATILAQKIMLLPAIDPRSGPFQGHQSCWAADENQLSEGERFVAVSFYLALVTTECLAMIGADGPIVVEGPFARNHLFLAMLGSAAGRQVETSEGSSTGTSIGAALLVSGVSQDKRSVPQGTETVTFQDPGLTAYALSWSKMVSER